MMIYYNYKVVPAPKKGVKSKGVKTADDRFAHAIELRMNELATEGWEYLRAETLPCEARSGLASHTTAYHNILVFRRAISSEAPQNEITQTAQKNRADRHATPPAEPRSDIDPAIAAVAASTEQSYPETEIDAARDADRARLKSAFDI